MSGFRLALRRSRTARVVLAGAAALTLIAGPTAVLDNGTASTGNLAYPCYNGIVPGNPYVQSCSLPRKTPQVRGAAPDAGAIIACRNFPGCLSWYVNNPH
jgi:hypothetical protein